MDPSSEPPRPAAQLPSMVDDAGPMAAKAAHIARFEFSQERTKILMVEWDPARANPTSGADDAAAAAADTAADTAADAGADMIPNSGPQPDSVATNRDGGHAAITTVDTTAWEVSWPGKSTFLPAHDTDRDGTRRRVYFLLPPDVPVPATVTINRPGHPSLTVNPLPAIFPEGFDADAGARGVLHTIWAKRRLSELEREMNAELRNNAESVGLDMVLAEKQWIIDNFLNPAPALDPTHSPAPPRPPVAGRLVYKLKGLRLATSPADLAPTSPRANTFAEMDGRPHSLSPQGGDIAVSSFSSITNSRAAPGSLDATVERNVAPNSLRSEDTDADLFALPISPRSPDMKKSPYSVLRAD